MPPARPDKRTQERGTTMNRRHLLKTMVLSGAGCLLGTPAAPGEPIPTDFPVGQEPASDQTAGNRRIMIA